MSKWIQAKESMQEIKFREEIEKLFIDYTPKQGCVSLVQRLTGEDEKQTLETEYNLGWHMTVINGKLILISHKATDAKIRLYGKIGWDNSDQILQEVCKYCYSNTELGVEASCLNPKEFEQLSEELQKTEERLYYLRNKRQSVYRFFVRCVIHAKVEKRTLYYHKEDTKVELSCSVRPVIELPDNILLLVEDKANDGSTPQRGMKIRIKEENSQERIDNLKREIHETEQHLRDLRDELNRLTSQK